MYISELIECKKKFHKSYKTINYIYLFRLKSRVLNSFIFLKYYLWYEYIFIKIVFNININKRQFTPILGLTYI